MTRRALPLMMGLLLLQMGCGITGPGTRLEPSELCSDHSDDAIPTFEDAALENATLDAVNRNEETPFLGTRVVHDNLTCGLISGLTEVIANSAGIVSLVGIQNLTHLTFLGLSNNSISDIGLLGRLTSLQRLDLEYNSVTDISAVSELTSLLYLYIQNNSITDIRALSRLTSLTQLRLDNNSITDISALSGLTGVTTLYLNGNSVTDISALSGLTAPFLYLNLNNNPSLSNIQPLLANIGLGAGDLVTLRSTSVSCLDVAALKAKGVEVDSDCP